MPSDSPIKTAVFVANRCCELTSSRMLLMTALLKQGWRVIALANEDNRLNALKACGIEWYSPHFNRGSVKAFKELASLRRLITFYKSIQPDLIHHFNSKPVILGSVAYQRAQVDAKLFNTITGVSPAFTQSKWRALLASIGYKKAFKAAGATIFQNNTDRRSFVDTGWIDASKAHVILSSGVDTQWYTPRRQKDEHHPFTVLLAARLIWQKGIGEFIQIAKQVKAGRPHVQFWLVGELELSHPDAVPKAFIDEACEHGFINYLGYSDHLRAIYQQADLFLFPSKYPEGMPRVVLEAQACGLPVIGTDGTGTNEAIKDGKTGFLLPCGDVKESADKIKQLMDDDSLWNKLALEARQNMERHFDIKAITHQYLTLYEQLGCFKQLVHEPVH